MTVSAENEAALWAAFSNYVTRPYQLNDDVYPTMKAWVDDLSARCLASGGLQLAFGQLKHAGTGKIIHAFSLNDALFFSHDAAVLTLPFPRQPSCNHTNNKGVASDEQVGFWLRDFGDHNALLKRSAGVLSQFDDTKRNPDTLNLDPRIHIKLECRKFEEADFIIRQIKTALTGDIGWATVDDALGQGEVRYAKKRPLADKWHRDVSLIKYEKNPEGDLWNYVIAYSFLNTGTAYLPRVPTGNRDKSESGGESIAVNAPLFAATSHFTLKAARQHTLYDNAGALHKARGHDEGRGIVIFPEFGTDRAWCRVTNAAPQWKFTACAL